MNLTALASRLSRICRSRVTSPLTAGRHVALEHVGEVELLLRRARADEVERRLDALAQIERLRLDVHAAGLDLREVEDVVDDREQRVAGVADRGGVVALLVVERRVEQQPAHADHRVHRRADLVAHRGEERALRLVRRLGLRARASCASAKSRALRSATPTLAAIVSSSRWSSAPYTPSRSVLCTLDHALGAGLRRVMGTPRYERASFPTRLAPIALRRGRRTSLLSSSASPVSMILLVSPRRAAGIR